MPIIVKALCFDRRKERLRPGWRAPRGTWLMSFELVVAENTPVSGDMDFDDAVMAFLTQIGYLSENYQPRTANAQYRCDSVPYLLFADYFLKGMGRGWTADELTKRLKTTPPTVYRHINKLQLIGIVGHSPDGSGGDSGKSIYRLRYGSLSLAWKIVEANVDAAKTLCRSAVDGIDESLQKDSAGKKAAEKAPADSGKRGRAGEAFRMRLADSPIDDGAPVDERIASLLRSIGYLEHCSGDPSRDKKSIPYRLFADCFLKRRDKLWEVDAMIASLRTSKPTVYRHVNKLLSLGIIEAVPIGENYPLKMGYRLRFSSLSKSWYFVENRIDEAMRNYRRSADWLQKAASAAAEGRGRGK